MNTSSIIDVARQDLPFPRLVTLTPLVVACLAAAFLMLFPLPARAQPAGAPRAVGGSVERVGSFQRADAPLDAPPAASAPAQRANPLAPGRPLQAPPPTQYPRSGNMPSPVDLVNEAIDQAAPLTAEEVRRFRSQLVQRQGALTENVTGRAPPKATTQIYNVDLSPGATPPVIRVEVAQGAIVSFLDATGKPWPARVADNFAPKSLTVSQFTEHQLSLGTGSTFPINVSVAVALEGLPTAITFSVISGQSKVDSQVHMIIPRYRDGVPPEVGVLRGQPTLNSRDLLSFLLRTPPQEARPLVVEGVPGVMAWQISSSRMVVRSASKVASGYFTTQGPQGLGDGTEVYELPLSPQIQFIYGDRMVAARVSGFTVGGFGGGK